jgi:phage N-6-adenine-methyltransferase
MTKRRCQRCRNLLPPAAPTGRPPRWCGEACKKAAYRCRLKRSVHFRSDSPEWSTPQSFFDEVSRRWGPFTLDVCATPENAKCTKFYTKAENGLACPWVGRVWCNPPYGRGIEAWVRKAWESAQKGLVEVVLLLVPARTDTRWWHTWCAQGEVEFVRGRLCFGGGESAPFPSALVLFRGQLSCPRNPCSLEG